MDFLISRTPLSSISSLEAHIWSLGYEAFVKVRSVARQLSIANWCHYVQYQLGISVWRILECYCLLRILEIRMNPIRQYCMLWILCGYSSHIAILKVWEFSILCCNDQNVWFAVQIKESFFCICFTNAQNSNMKLGIKSYVYKNLNVWFKKNILVCWKIVFLFNKIKIYSK